MILSILIPIYNEDVRPLVKSLLAQAASLSSFEILCFDDGSKDSFKSLNRQLINLAHVNYREMPDNLGRSKIRNVLADAAGGTYLLFMDCDSKVVTDHYIDNYAKHLDVNTLLYGGRCYNNRPPVNDAFCLHWKYGIQREQQIATNRQQQPYHSFMTNNFLIPAQLFHRIRFDESLKQYGHEDTLFGMELRKQNIRILHLDNPLEHIGLEPADVFLDKTAKAIENLHRLISEGKPVDTKLLRVHRRLQYAGLDRLVYGLYDIFRPMILKHLKSRNANMKVFDFYKLGLLIRQQRQE